MIAVDVLSDLLGDGATTPLDSRALEFLEEGAVGDVEKATHRTFRPPVSLTEYHNGTFEQWLDLRCPVTSGTPVVSFLQGGAWSDPLSVSTYAVRPHPELGINSRLHLLWGLWPYGQGNVRVTYTGGYPAGEEPADVRMLVAGMAALRFRDRPVAVSADAEEKGKSALPDHLKAILNRWTFYCNPEASRLVRV